MIAALPMYDFGDLQGANDRLWQGIRDNLRGVGIAAPEALTRDMPDIWRLWRAPDLVLAQTCGSPYRNRLHGHVTLIGTPDYGLEGCAPGEYYSVFVVRSDDPREKLAEFEGAQLAYNEPLSQSGWAAPQNHALKAGLRLLPGVETGAHRLSAQAVAAGQADIAALDAVTWRVLQRIDPVAGDLRVIAQTEPTTGLPLIAALNQPRELIFDAVTNGISALPPKDRDILGLQGLTRISAEAYLSVPNPPSPAQIGKSSCANWHANAAK